uniref:DUF541 domain-containing protein n=1 Tax=Francisella tularensis subsp. novicida PA10-7858 TaxID=1386968 RepID=V5T998_FRANO|nr:hypothetical protein [Francisella tularensis]AHB60792.1 hypothetical protein N894_0024 [Francisella tularensis subsp. novicida PA10-7858]
MKKLISVCLIGLVGSVSFAVANSDNCIEYNTIKYTTQAETTIKSDSILVEVTGYATTTLDKQNSVENQITDSINNIVKSDWKVKNIEQKTSNSGAINITIQLQSRISQGDLNKLQQVIENQDRSSGKRLVVKVLDYNPPAKEVEAAKQQLMIQLFKDTRDYLANFNKQTNSSYIIQSMQYTDINEYQSRNTVMLMKSAAYNESDTSNYNPVAISQDINIKANVTFMEK